MTVVFCDEYDVIFWSFLDIFAVLILIPSILSSPLFGLTKEEIKSKRVVLPIPLFPEIPIISPFDIDRFRY